MTKFLHQPCVSIGLLFGGAKNQKGNLKIIPDGSQGIAVCLTENDYGVQYYQAKFEIDGVYFWTKCSPFRITLV